MMKTSNSGQNFEILVAKWKLFSQIADKKMVGRGNACERFARVFPTGRAQNMRPEQFFCRPKIGGVARCRTPSPALGRPTANAGAKYQTLPSFAAAFCPKFRRSRRSGFAFFLELQIRFFARKSQKIYFATSRVSQKAKWLFASRINVFFNGFNFEKRISCLTSLQK